MHGWKIVVILLILCRPGVSQTGATREYPIIVARPWPQADALFRNDRRWLGATMPIP